MSSGTMDKAKAICLVGAILALNAVVFSVPAQEAAESKNPRVRELVDAGQGALLPLGEALGPTQAIPSETEEILEPQVADENETEVVVDDVGSEDDSFAMETADVSVDEVDLPDDAEEVGSTSGGVADETEPVDEWPPPVDEMNVSGLVQEAIDSEAMPEPPVVEVEELEPSEPVVDQSEPDPESLDAVGDDPEVLDAGLVPRRTAELGNPETIGPYRLWLASYKTVREAKAGWEALAVEHQDLFSDLTPVIVLKDLGTDEGTFFRLQAGPLQNQTSALSRCDAIQQRELYCTVLGP